MAVTDLLKAMRRFLIGEGPDQIDSRAKIAKDMIDKEAKGLKADIQKLVQQDDPLDALMRNVMAVRNQAKLGPTHH